MKQTKFLVISFLCGIATCVLIRAAIFQIRYASWNTMSLDRFVQQLSSGAIKQGVNHLTLTSWVSVVTEKSDDDRFTTSIRWDDEKVVILYMHNGYLHSACMYDRIAGHHQKWFFIDSDLLNTQFHTIATH